MGQVPDLPSRALKEQSQPKFHLPRSVRLAGDNAKAPRAVDIQSWVGGLKMIQHIQKLKTQSSPHALSNPNVLSNSQVEVEGSEAAENTCATTIVVDSQNQSPET